MLAPASGPVNLLASREGRPIWSRKGGTQLKIWLCGSALLRFGSDLGKERVSLSETWPGSRVQGRWGLLRKLENGLHEFVVHLRVGAANGIGCAIFKIVPKNDPRDLPQGVLSSGKLGQHFHARPLRVDHLLDAPELSLCGLEPPEAVVFSLVRKERQHFCF